MSESGVESTILIKNISKKGQDSVDRRQARPFQAWRIERVDASGVGHSHVPSVKRDNFNFVNKEKEKNNAGCYYL